MLTRRSGSESWALNLRSAHPDTLQKSVFKGGKVTVIKALWLAWVQAPLHTTCVAFAERYFKTSLIKDDLHPPSSYSAYMRTQNRTTQRMKFQRITSQQTQVHLRLSWGSVHGSYCSNIELGGMAWGLLYVLLCVWKWIEGRSLRWQDLRLNKLHRMTTFSAWGQN